MTFNVINNANDMVSHRVRTFNKQKMFLVWPDDGQLRPKHVAYYLIYL
jgi:hypothetical protein